VRAAGVAATSLCVGWRADDVRPAVESFVKVATTVAGDLGMALDLFSRPEAGGANTYCR
jgi:hypothetical protein